MFLKLFGCNTVVLLHNILEQVDLEVLVLPRTSWLQKFNLIGTNLTKCILKADVAVTISKYVDVLGEKYKSENVSLIPHGSLKKRKRLI
jgi:hypothetical protein